MASELRTARMDPQLEPFIALFPPADLNDPVAIERIGRGIVNVGCEDAFFEVVEDDHVHRPTEPTNARSCSSTQTCVLDCHRGG